MNLSSQFPSAIQRLFPPPPPPPSPSPPSSTSPSRRPRLTPPLHLSVTSSASQCRPADHLPPLSSSSPSPLLRRYSLLLKSYIRSRKFHLGKLLHSSLAQSELPLDTVILNSLISLYSKSGDIETAAEVFEDMGDMRDLVSWSSMISCFANNGMESRAILTFVEMLEHEFEPNEYCFTAVLRACSVAKYSCLGEAVLGFLTKCGYFDAHICVGCALIDMFAKGKGDLELAYKVFDRMPEKNVVTWTQMITRCTQMGCPGKAIDLFSDMLMSGTVPDRFAVSAALSACSDVESLHLGVQLHSLAIRSGIASDVCVGCSLVDMYAKCSVGGSMFCSRKVFDRMSDRNVMAWTAIITGYVQSDKTDEAVSLFLEMIKGTVKPNHFTFASILKACGDMGDVELGRQCYAQAVKSGLMSDTCIGNSLISMFAGLGRMEDARRAFCSLFNKNLISYNALVDGYVKMSNSEEAFGLFSEIEDKGIGTSAFTFASLLSGAASIGAIGKGEQIHARMVKLGFDLNLAVCNSLISMYARCGDIRAAYRVFGEMDDRNVITYTSMVTGFAKHGFATRALDTFQEMVDSGVRPNAITYVAVLSSCSHVGLVSEGWEHFWSMQTKFGIAPRMEHYACMVDLLSRSGSFDAAFQFIRTMPIEADVLVWRTFLGACRVHDNAEFGELAAEIFHERFPDDPSACVLLSNIYASKGQWDEAANVRKKMKLKNITKEAGCSWIEVGNTTHRFYVADTSHEQAREIYEELDRRVSKIRKSGYVPKTDLVLHDVEEEQKEQYLLQHSEKLAVVFGLISTPGSSRPIRVFKNLRICGDCHSAIKLLSMETGRVIIVRDGNRFHHFVNGLCSCNDYW
ncbi:hypothetical protein MLD38_033516 [Melastoma candidum]|uniref:Uncharacterized protein n=1 Tax=Melastoma candidum TaxID=119954 RepID=A0ACB9M6Z8_9MYRT|nr:hypothetical protein MLD38_033516 [Melastoma candidum]